MKKLLLAIFTLLTVLTLSACAECEECAECTVCTECEECATCEENPQLSFYEEMEFEGEGYTPGYTYYLSGTLNEDAEVTDIRFNMVSVYGTSKRSTDYGMNVAKIQVGGTDTNQTLDIYVGGSTENISQVYNNIAGSFVDGTETLYSLGFKLSYPGQVISNSEEIYGLMADALDITIDSTTTISAFLDAAGLVDEGVIENGRKVIELEGYKGGGNFDHQLASLETHIITNALTLEEVYELVSENNQGFDGRDAVAGATIMFDKKIIAIVAQAANIEISNDPLVIGSEQSGTDTVIGVRVYGMYEITVSVTIDNTGTITAMEVIDHNETSGIGEAVIDGTYLAGIISGQTDLSGIDSVSGATLTSTALVDAAQAAITEYNK